MDNKEALACLQKELKHQKYCLDIEKTQQDEHAVKKRQVIIDALEIAADAVSKQISKKPLDTESRYDPALCPNCGAELSEFVGDGIWKDDVYLKRCYKCDQKLAWGEQI